MAPDNPMNEEPAGARRERPLRTAGELASYVYGEAADAIDNIKEAGEFRMIFDVWQWKGLITLHVPWPGIKKEVAKDA